MVSLVLVSLRLQCRWPGNIISRYDEGLCYIFDFEQNNTKDRFRAVTGLSESFCDDHVTILRDGISAESVVRTVAKIRELKLQHEKELLVPNENGIKDEDGNLVKVLPPTVIIIDSLALVMGESIDMGEVDGAMTATGNARLLAQVFKKLANLCNKANIIILCVNHITQNIGIGVTPPSAQVNYLKQDESLPGGKTPVYLTDTLIKITPSTKLEEDKLWGIKGFEAKVEICKSRRAPAGRAVNMIYDQTSGFRNDLSMLDYIKSCGALKGNGMAYYIEGYETTKFRLSNFKEKFDTIPEFHDVVVNKARELMQASIRESTNIQAPAVEENMEVPDEEEI